MIYVYCCINNSCVPVDDLANYECRIEGSLDIMFYPFRCSEYDIPFPIIKLRNEIHLPLMNYKELYIFSLSIAMIISHT